MPFTTMNLEPKDILRLEFEYANKTAEQAQDDRTAMMNLYLLLVGGVGSIVAAVFQSGSALNIPRHAFALLFALLAITGFFVLLKLVRLRQAWYDSVRAMNQIKNFYLRRFPELDDAILWKMETIPARGKLWTITFNLCLLVAILDSVALAVAVNFFGFRSLIDYLPEFFAAALYFLWQLWFYFLQLPITEKTEHRHAET